MPAKFDNPLLNRWILIFTIAETLPIAVNASESLPFPAEIQSIETASRSVSGVTLAGDQLIILTSTKDFLIRLPFTKENRNSAWGSLENQMRIKPHKEIVDFRGAHNLETKLLLLDGTKFELHLVDVKRKQHIMSASPSWDLIRPARDSRGEATAPEVSELRRRFATNFPKANSPRFTGLAALPNGWHKTRQGKTQYLLISRIKDFPLTILECDEEEPASCMLTRNCYLEGAAGLKVDARFGIGISVKRRLVVLGDAEANKLWVFKFSSCFHIPKTKTITIPEKIFTMTNLHIDSEDRLWLTTDKPDNYNNSSLYYWDSW
jgi:hypothetical protein